MTRRVHSLRMRRAVCVCISAWRGLHVQPPRFNCVPRDTSSDIHACVYTYALAALNMLMYGGSDSIVRPIFHWRIDPAICARIFAPTTLSDFLPLFLAVFLSQASLLRCRCTCKNHRPAGCGGRTVHRLLHGGFWWVSAACATYWVFAVRRIGFEGMQSLDLA